MMTNPRRANFKIDVQDAGMLRMIERAGGKTAISRIALTLKREAEELAREAEATWPRSHTYQGKFPKGSDRSAEAFKVESRITPQVVAYSVVNTAPYAYYVRSVQIGESAQERRSRYFWRRGTSTEDYNAQRTVGRKRHAWTTLVVRPANRAAKRIAAEVGDDLLKLIEGR